MGKECRSCFYNTKQKSCKILTKRIEINCFAWADEAEAKKREKEIKNYSEEVLPNAMSEEEKELRRISTEKNREARGGRSSYEVLDEHYSSMQEQGFTVMEIARALNVDRNRIYDYINKYDLPAPIKKSRHVGA